MTPGTQSGGERTVFSLGSRTQDRHGEGNGVPGRLEREGAEDCEKESMDG